MGGQDETRSQLVAIPRGDQREHTLGSSQFDGFGVDIWRTSECTWLDRRGKPTRGELTITVPCTTRNMVESKSLKLYLMSFALTCFASKLQLQEEITSSLNNVLGSECRVEINTRAVGFEFDGSFIESSHRLDYIPLGSTQFQVSRDTLAPRRNAVKASGRYHTDCFRCLCPVTGQPDYASVVVSFEDAWVSAESLLAYLLSYRTHGGYHESTIEQIYFDVKTVCQPNQLSVFGSFARRGGIDIAVFRSSQVEDVPNWRSPIC